MKVDIIGGGPAGPISRSWRRRLGRRCGSPSTSATGRDTFGSASCSPTRRWRPSRKRLESSGRSPRTSPTGTTSRSTTRHGASLGAMFLRLLPGDLLRLLHEPPARSARAEIPDRIRFATASDADLAVAADGINSRIRAKHAAAFKPGVDLRPNKFAWMGSTRPFDAFTFFSRDRARHFMPIAINTSWAIDLGDGDRSRDVRAPGLDKLGDADVREISRRRVRQRARRPRAIINRRCGVASHHPLRSWT